MFVCWCLLGCLGGLVLLLIVLVSADVVRIYSYLLFWLFLVFYCWMLVFDVSWCFDVLLLLFIWMLELIVFGWALLECAGDVWFCL